MKKIKINMYAKGLNIKGQGVGSATIEQMEMVKNIKDFDVTINKAFKRKYDIRHYDTIIISHFFKFSKKGINVCDVHFIPEKDDGSLKMPRFMFGPYRHYTLKFYRKVDEIIVVNPYFIDDLIKIGIPKERITYIPNVVSKSRFYKLDDDRREQVRKEYGIESNEFIVLGVGQTQTRKGILDFVKICENNPDMKFLWAGGFTFGKITAGYEEISKVMKNPPKNMRFLGIIDREKMNDLYNACDVLFLPSYQELFPMTLLECINCDKPFLVRDLELYDRIFTKEYIKGTNNQEFESILKKLKEDSNFYQKATNISLELAKFYSVENVTKLWSEYYNRIYLKYPNRVNKHK